MSEKIDVLDREGFINKLSLLVKMLSDKKKGCCFGIDGAWGSGKTFVIKKFEEQLKYVQSEETADSKYFVFHYDCWKYDYYDEPAIAIVASMLDETDRELSLFSAGMKDAGKLALETVKKTLLTVADELCKNKIGISLVEIASDVLKEHDSVKDRKFDSLYGFKKALEETRTGIQKIADSKTVVIIVDELDRCLPTYSIKVLERLHHIFNELDNVIVIVTMDKNQLSHSIQEIYGDIDVDTYLRKFISFKATLDNGKASSYSEKFKSFFSMFDISHKENEEIESFFTDILVDLDMRTQERIFNKAEIIHAIIKNDEVRDCSIMTFEILYLTVSLKTKTKNLRWLSIIWSITYTNYKKKLGDQYYNMLNEYGKKAFNNTRHNDLWVICDTIIGKTFFWLANMNGTYIDGECKPYIYHGAEKRVELVHQFAELVNIIDSD